MVVVDLGVDLSHEYTLVEVPESLKNIFIHIM